MRDHPEPPASDLAHRAAPPLGGQLRVPVFGVIAAAITVGLLSELFYAHSPSDNTAALAELFSLSFEQNVPTHLATCLLFSCGLALAAVSRQAARGQRSHRVHWNMLAGLFFYFSLDELVEIHERLGGVFSERVVDVGDVAHGLLYFDWVIPAALFVVCIGLLYLPFLRALAPPLRRRIVVAGTVYVAGALLLELPLGMATVRFGDGHLLYGLIDWVEESLELIGAGLFLVAIVDSWEEVASR